MNYTETENQKLSTSGQAPRRAQVPAADAEEAQEKDPALRRARTLVLRTETGYEREVMNAFNKYVLLPSEEAYFPIVELEKRIHGQDRRVEKSLYPGYLFIRTQEDPTDVYFRGQFSKGQTVFRYIRLLRNDEIMLPISRDEEKMLYELCGDDHRVDFSRGLIEGGKVVITSGPLKTFKGTIKKIDRHKKTAKITTKMFNREMDVIVGLEIISKEV